ncbi:MAG: AAA domain-containing protein [Nannocystaceae bacterium]|nr:AAA domain-containing protein [bacterium]
MAEGLADLQTQTVHPFSAQLRAFQQRLLQVDARNPSVFTGRIVKKRNFDLCDLDPKKAEKAFAHVIAGGGRQRLLGDSSGDKESMARREHLRQVAKTAADREEETGLEDLRVATAWVEGRVDERTYVRAPLLLRTATLQRVRGAKSGWTLEVPKEGELQVNQALLGALAKGLRWHFPEDAQAALLTKVEELAQQKEKSAGALLKLVTEALEAAELPLVEYDDGPRVLNKVTKAEAMAEDGGGPELRVRGFAVVGVFPQSSTALYSDYEDLATRADGGEVDQGIVDNLLETPGDPDPTPMSDGEGTQRAVDLDQVPASSVHVALPCDPSQYAILCEAQWAECTVVRGPPGTGKSQVIANLVVDALSRGERVLVVCQKRAALDVVQARLRATGLTPWTYVVHDATADRGAVYSQLRQGIELSRKPAGPDARASLAQTSAAIDRTMAELRAIVDPLATSSHGRPLSHWYRQAPRAQALPADLPAELVALGWDEVQRLLDEVAPLRPSALAFSGERAATRMRRSWAGFGPREQGAILEAVDRIASLAATQSNSLVLVPREQIEGLRAVLLSYRELVGRWWKFLLPRWWRTKKAVAEGAGALGNRPPEQWDAPLDVATSLRESLDGLRNFFAPAWVDEIEAALRSGAGQQLERVRDVVGRDFERVVQLDARLAKLQPWAHHLLAREDPRLLAAGGVDPTASSPDEWAVAVRRNVILHWIEQVERQHPALRGEPFVEYRRLRDQLVGLLQQQAELTKQAVVQAVHEHSRRREHPPEMQGSRAKPETIWNKLEHELGKQRRRWPLRKTLREFEWPLRHLARAWLLSPEVAAEVLPLERGCFDLAIFDEASQLPLERALPVLYRSKRIVIAGDEQQMPPSRFFERGLEDEDVDEDGETIEDARAALSLLEQAKKIYGFRYLGWHYRSEFGELIEFSNQAFYDGGLHITPPPRRSGASAPISFHAVDGIWEKQTNFAEANKCVELIESIARANEAKPKSIGVVTVNMKQQQAIDAAIRREEEARPEFAELLHALRHPASGSRDDALIIKNIENIQGDERDVIIFSTGYARPARDRTMRRNFGAIGQAGGENRLNVAFTRARSQMHVLCSFDPAEVSVEGAKNRGPKVLLTYLQYARAVSEGREEVADSLVADLSQATERNTPGQGKALQFDSDFEEQVYDALHRRGLELDTQVGSGGYRIDLAVVDPRDPTRYCLAIECDGAAYHSGRSVRERDVARQQLLEGRGWTFERIWSRDWWRNPQAEVERIVGRVAVLSEG